jgi:signal transduction histidine kinase
MELSICREIARQHGGEISAESFPERDTIFRVTLPGIPRNH